MKRVLAAAVLLLSALVAVAQALPPIAFKVPDCVPKTKWTPQASGSELKNIEYPGAQIYAFRCPGVALPYVHVDVTGSTVSLHSTLTLMDSAADPVGALRNLIAGNQVQPSDAEQYRLWYMAHSFGMAVMSLEAKVYTHAVMPNPASTEPVPTRPARKVVNGVLTTFTNPPRVPVGTDCDLDVLPTFPSGTDVWAAVVGQPTDLRWACRKK